MTAPLHAHDRQPPLAPHDDESRLSELVRDLARVLTATLRRRPDPRRRQRPERRRHEQVGL